MPPIGTLVSSLSDVGSSLSTDLLLLARRGVADYNITIAEFVNQSILSQVDAFTAGMSITVSNPQVGNNQDLRRALDLNVTTDSSTSVYGFPDECAMYIEMTPTHGQNTGSGGIAKTSFFPLLIQNHSFAAGQKFVLGENGIFYGMGDSFLETMNCQYASGNINGDEGVGFGPQNLLSQQIFLAQNQIRTIGNSGCTINTTTSQAINQTDGVTPVQQTISVVSAAGISATGTPNGNWVVVGQELSSSNINLEVVQVLAVDTVANTITAVFRNIHLSGVTITPALVLNLYSGLGLGQQRVLVNTSGSTYSTGTVSHTFSGATFTGSGTSWTNSMVGGSELNIGAIAFTPDTYAGTGSSPFNGADTNINSSAPLRSWYQINHIFSGTTLDIFSNSTAGDAAYYGKVTTGANYIIRPAARILRIVDGNQVICETSTHTWSPNDMTECAICPYPDVTAWSWQIAAYTTGGIHRGFESVLNVGARTIGFGYSVSSNMQTGSNSDIGWGFEVGYQAGQCWVGFQVFGVRDAAIRLGAADMASDQTDVGGRIDWGVGGRYIQPNSTNHGMDINPTISGSSDSVDGLLNFVASTVSGTSTVGFRGTNNISSMAWGGTLDLYGNSGAGRDVAISFSSANGAPGNPWKIQYCNGTNSILTGEVGIDFTYNDSSTHCPFSITTGFVRAKDKLGIGTNPSQTLHLAGTVSPILAEIDYTGTETSGYTGLQINTLGGAKAQLLVLGSSYTTSGIFNANGLYLLGYDNSAPVGIIADGTGSDIVFATKGIAITDVRLTVSSAGNIVSGNAALATNATDGFVYLNSCAGTPTGTPTSYTGRVPLVINSSTGNLYGYQSGSWSILGGGGGGAAIGSSVTSGTSGSMLYVDSSGNLAQDNANVFWDATNHRLGINTTSPSYNLHVNESTNGIVAIVAQNTSSGSSAQSSFYSFNDLGHFFTTALTSSTFTGREDTVIIACVNCAGGITIETTSAAPIVLSVNGINGLTVTSTGSVVIQGSALATTATDGFLYISSCPGAPTGTPTTYTGTVPLVINSSTGNLYTYQSGAWSILGGGGGGGSGTVTSVATNSSLSGGTITTSGTLSINLANSNTWAAAQLFTAAQTTFTPTETIASGASAVWDGVLLSATTATLSGSTNITTSSGFNLHTIKGPTITSGSAITVTNAATLAISAAPVGAGSTTITNAYSLWNQAGKVRFDGAFQYNNSPSNGFILGSDASGNASWVNTNTITTLGTITSGTWTGTTVAIANGGTGNTTAANAINALLPSQTSNSGKFLTTNGSVASWGSQAATLAIGGSVTSGTTGSVLYIDGSGNLAQDNSHLFWDSTNHRLGVGTTSPLYDIHISNPSSTVLLFTESGATTDNKHWYFNALGTTFFWGVLNDVLDSGNNYIQINRSGLTISSINMTASNINIGNNASPTGMFSVGNSSQTQIDGSGNINGVTLNLGTSFAAGLKQSAAAVLSATNGSSGNGWLKSPAGTSYLTSNFTDNTGTLANTVLTIPGLIAGRVYVGRVDLWLSNSTAADGGQFDFNGGTVTATTFLAGAGIFAASSATSVQGVTISQALATAINWTAFGNTSVINLVFDVMIKVNAAGSITFRAAENSHTSGTLTILAGSSFRLEDIT